MKKFSFFVLTVLVSSLGLPLFAQEKRQLKVSEYYYVSVPIEKIFTYRNGYIVVYRKGVNRMARTYLPKEWFANSTGKAETISLEAGKAWPYLTIYYKSGQFSHIRVYVRRERAHQTWGVVPMNVNIDEYFEGVEEIKLEF
ncbi:MAG: hypothetical protein LBQ67_01370 [Treponema sp.]|jgi:hypothetical protein|nr:hypothetical protein [Treponema sp.]